MHKVPTFVGKHWEPSDAQGEQHIKQALLVSLVTEKHVVSESSRCSRSYAAVASAVAAVSAVAVPSAEAAADVDSGSMKSPKFWFSNSIMKMEQSSPWNLRIYRTSSWN